MVANTREDSIQSLFVVKEVDIAAPLQVAYSAVLDDLGPESELPDGTPFPMVFEAWPGGRWFRDLGNNAGHFWGHVQVIKPPTLIEICGPLFMSYAATSHLQYRLTDHGDRTHLKLTHRAIGQITAEHREGVHEGWEHWLQHIRDLAERKNRKET
jgi:uncharacterized protein YndB with AHSA1/START domain